jgi:two-component system sensor histidine kinase BaeS
MKPRLLWKLLLLNSVPVIGIIILVVWLAVDHLAANYFMILMQRYHIEPTNTHHMFIAAVHRYLAWAALAALFLALLLSYLLTRRILRPLYLMTSATAKIASGTYSERLEITSRDEIGHLAGSFNRMADSLEKLDNLRKTMVADAAHELRTPLTNLRGYMEALSDGVIPPSTDTFRMLQDEIMRLVGLVEELQQLAKADTARAFLNRQELSLHGLIEQILRLYGPNFLDKQIRVETRFSPSADTVRADRDRLLQVLRNLLENAWKFTPKQGTVIVSTERTTEGIKVLFKNSGEGIPAEDLPHIFERFYRAERSRSRETGGAGIGLSIVRELVEAHGGSVGSESSGGVTSIWFVLPA